MSGPPAGPATWPCSRLDLPQQPLGPRRLGFVNSQVLRGVARAICGRRRNVDLPGGLVRPTAVQSVDKDLIEVARAFGHGSAFARLFKVVLPAASPGILGGLRTGLGQGWMTVIAAELFGIPGIGQRMIEASGLLATDVVVLYMLTIGALYGVTDYIFVLVQNRLLAWQK